MGVIISVSNVLEFIDPVDPDNLQHTGNGVYLAKWAPPLLMMDVELLRSCDGVEITKDLHELETPQGWWGIKFEVGNG